MLGRFIKKWRLGVKRAAVLCILSMSQAPAVLALDLSISVEGGADGLRDDARSVALLAGLGQGAARADVIAAAKADYARLVGLLYDQGYFAPEVSIRLDGREAAQISNFAGGAAISRAEIRITPGKVFRFGRATVGPYPPGLTAPDAFATGAPASLNVMQRAARKGIESWRAAGHAKADLGDETIIARHATAELDVDIRLAPGPRLRFGTLVVGGDTSLSPDRVRQIAGLPSGEVYDPSEVDRAGQRLRRTGAFESVTLLEAEQIGPEQTLDIDVELRDAPLRRFGFGAELSTEQGITLSGFWLHRNLLGGAERLRFDAEVRGLGGDTGGEDFELGLRYVRPGTPTYRTDLFVDGAVSSVEEPNLSSDRFGLRAGLLHYSSDNREYTYALGFEAAETEDAFGKRDYQIVTLPATHTRDYRDDALDATDGYYAHFELTPFLGISGTDAGARFFADGRIYRSVGADNRVTFALRGQLGSLSGPELARAPADYLFFSGGGGLVRGQEFQSLGVELPNGRTSGGRSFLGLSAELRVKTGENLSVVGFWDAGYIGSEAFPDGSSGEWHTGAGAGISYDTGVGPVRVDLAVPVTGPGSNSGFELYIGIGQAF